MLAGLFSVHSEMVRLLSLVGLPLEAEADKLLWMLEQGQPETVFQRWNVSGRGLMAKQDRRETLVSYLRVTVEQGRRENRFRKGNVSGLGWLVEQGQRESGCQEGRSWGRLSDGTGRGVAHGARGWERWWAVGYDSLCTPVALGVQGLEPSWGPAPSEMAQGWALWWERRWAVKLDSLCSPVALGAQGLEPSWGPAPSEMAQSWALWWGVLLGAFAKDADNLLLPVAAELLWVGVPVEAEAEDADKLVLMPVAAELLWGRWWAVEFDSLCSPEARGARGWERRWAVEFDSLCSSRARGARGMVPSLGRAPSEMAQGWAFWWCVFVEAFDEDSGKLLLIPFAEELLYGRLLVGLPTKAEAAAEDLLSDGTGLGLGDGSEDTSVGTGLGLGDGSEATSWESSDGTGLGLGDGSETSSVGTGLGLGDGSEATSWESSDSSVGTGLGFFDGS
jgi:hypothetical protein